MFVIIAILLILTLLYYLTQKNYEYWEKKGVKGPKPTFLFGNYGDVFLMKKQPGLVLADLYSKYKSEQVVGLFRSFTPTLLIRDPDLIKEVVTKSFSHFHDNDINVDKKTDPFFGRNPFVLKDEEWKRTRAKLTPAFTSGKMKWLYPYLEINGQKMVDFVQNVVKNETFEAKELASRFTLNNIGDCVFGIEANCFEDENSEFRRLANDFLAPGSWAVVAFTMSAVVPFITKIFSVKVVPKHVEDQLTSITQESLSYREKNNIVRNDMFEILTQLKKNTTDGSFTDVDVLAHSATFFGDGYETSSVAMSYMMFHLAKNQKVQSELRKELKTAFDENAGKLPYEVLQTLPYLDAVIHESLRVNPPANFLQKMCTKTCSLPLKGTTLEVEKGTPILFSIYGLHQDPEFFPDPDQYKPERFLGENKENIKKCSFMPFGEGQRTCLGQRFGLLQIKVGMAYIVKNFEITTNDKTKLPLKYDPTNLLMSPIGGLWLNFNKVDN